MVHYVGQLLAYNVPRATLEQDFDPKTAQFTDPGYVAALKQYKDALRPLHRRRVGERHAPMPRRCSSSATASRQCTTRRSSSSIRARRPIGAEESPTSDSSSCRSRAGAKGDPKAIEGAPEGYMINTASKNIPLAIDFMKFVTSKEHGQMLSAPPYGQPSATIGGASEDTMSPAVVARPQGADVASYLMPWLDTANSPRVAAAWLSSLQALAGGSMTPEQVMDQVQAGCCGSAR